MNCCGKDVVTPFCPMCGKKSEEPLAGLLHHLRTQLESHELVRDEAEKEVSAVQNDRERARCENRLSRLVKTAAKWKAWADAVEAVLVSRGVTVAKET